MAPDDGGFAISPNRFPPWHERWQLMISAFRETRGMGAKRRKPGEEGFTLVEMIVVLAIIGLIAAVAVPQVMKALSGSKTKAAKIQLETVMNSLHYYNIDVGTYPSQEQGLKLLWTANGIEGWDGPYVRREEQLIDPWGRPLLYAVPGTDGPFELKSLGADGKEGGTGADADISLSR